MKKSPRRSWLTHRYGKTTFWSQWGCYFALGIGLLLLPIFAAGKFSWHQLPDWHRAYISYLGPFILGGCAITIMLWPLIRDSVQPKPARRPVSRFRQRAARRQDGQMSCATRQAGLEIESRWEDERSAHFRG